MPLVQRICKISKNSLNGCGTGRRESFLYFLVGGERAKGALIKTKHNVEKSSSFFKNKILILKRLQGGALPPVGLGTAGPSLEGWAAGRRGAKSGFRVSKNNKIKIQESNNYGFNRKRSVKRSYF